MLDLGCSTGWLAAALKARGDVEVVGIEREPAYAAERAASAATASWSATSRTSRSDLGRFDCLVAADVLEHLVDPWTRARRATSRLLEPGCRAIVSLPNVAHWTTFAALARGSWPRQPEGIHDATHLRWFTLRDASSCARAPACGSSTSSAGRGCCGAAPGWTATPGRSRGCRRSRSSTCSPRDARRMARP